MISTAVASAPYFGATQADTFWLMLCGFLVFFMQCGFALLEAGTVRAKNTKNILLKNLLDACLGVHPPSPRLNAPTPSAPNAPGSGVSS